MKVLSKQELVAVSGGFPTVFTGALVVGGLLGLSSLLSTNAVAPAAVPAPGEAPAKPKGSEASKPVATVTTRPHGRRG